MSTPLRPAERAYSLSTRHGWEQFVTAPPRQRPDPLTLAQVRKLPEAARAEYEERRSVWHANIGPLRTPQMRAVHEQLDDIVEANRQDGDKVKGAAVIDAYPGLGKSTIAQVFAREFHQRQISLYGPVTEGGHDRIPVAHVCLTSSTSKRSFNAMLCRFFGLLGHDKGNAEELGHKAADAVLSCDVRLCVVDDVHFLDPARRDGRDVANHFKYLANTFPLTFLFVGVGLYDKSVGCGGSGPPGQLPIASMQILRRPGRLEPDGPVHLNRVAEVSRHPAGCVEAHGRIAGQRCQVRLKVLELGGPDLPLPLIAQLVEDRLTLAQHLEAERGDLKEHAAGVAGVCAACHVSALLQHRDGFRRCLLGDGQAAAEF